MKNNNIAIFIFTKDRPLSLKRALNSIKCLQINKYIFDDSYYNINQKKNQKTTSTIKNACYIGKSEFDNFTLQNRIEISDNTSLLRRFGNKKWNLGYVRNFALLFAKSLCIDEVLFMDDDIELIETELVNDSFSLLGNYDFVGAHITGMADDSILGYVSKELDMIENDRMLSGGFLLFNPLKINIPFTNFYNEDWIWLYLQSKDNKYIQKGEVIQSLCNPFVNYKDRIIFQEFGEIIIDGILEIYKNDTFEKLMYESYWEVVLNERIEYLNQLHSLSKQRNERLFLEMINWVLINYSQFHSGLFANTFKTFFNNVQVLQELYSLCNQNSEAQIQYCF